MKHARKDAKEDYMQAVKKSLHKVSRKDMVNHMETMYDYFYDVTENLFGEMTKEFKELYPEFSNDENTEDIFRIMSQEVSFIHRKHKDK